MSLSGFPATDSDDENQVGVRILSNRVMKLLSRQLKHFKEFELSSLDF